MSRSLPRVALLGRFEVEALSSAGGMGSVFRARDLATGARVAVKTLREDALQHAARFEREVAVLAELSHPAIVRYVTHGHVSLDGSESGRDLVLVMEWLEGESLSQRLEREGLSVEDGLALARRVAEGLGEAHRRGIVHRDLKPSNVFLEDRDPRRPKILDFGIARRRGAGELTQAGTVLGTPGYMAPEQARSDPSVDARADVYALGALLFRCLTGRRVHVGEDHVAVLLKTLLEDPPRLRDLRPDLPPALDALLARMLARAPADRPADGAAVMTELDALPSLSGAAAPRLSLPAARALTDTERRVMSVVLVRALLPSMLPDLPTRELPTRVIGPGAAEAPAEAGSEGLEAALRMSALRFGARMDVLTDDVVALGFLGEGTASDLASRAARCALEIRDLLPQAPIVLATGWGEAGGRSPVGEVLDRAAEALRFADPGDAPPSSRSVGGARRAPRRLGIAIDRVTSSQLEGAFDLYLGPRGPELRGERERFDARRTVLGRPVPMVGRDHELQTLLGLFSQATDDPGARVAIVTAGAGMGKTRLRLELVSALRSRAPDVEVWVGRGDAMSAGAPFAMLGSALASAFGARPGEGWEIGRERILARLGVRLPLAERERAAALLGHLAGLDPPAEELGRLAAVQDPVAIGDLARSAFLDFFAAETEAPLLLCLEDMQWGDVPSVRALEAALRTLGDRPWMLLVLARPELNDAFPGLFEDASPLALRLPPLPRRAAERLVRDLLGEELAASQGARVVELAQGNAFFLEELLRSVAEGGGELPETVLAMAQARLSELPPDLRRVLRAASVFGRTAWRGGVAAVSGEGPELDGALAELERRDLLSAAPRPRYEGERELVFRQTLVREAAYALLTAADRELAHLRAAEWLEAREPSPLVVAEHFTRAGAHARAAAWFARAATQALEGNDYRAAVAHARSGADGARGEALAELLGVEAVAHRWLADHASAEAAALRALDEAPRGSAAWCLAATEAAMAASRLSHFERVREIGAEVCLAAEEGAGTNALEPALGAAAVQLFYAADQGAADRCVAHLERRCKSGTTDLGNAWLSRVRAYRAMIGGRWVESAEFTARSIEQLTVAGDLRMASSLSATLGFIECALGLVEPAEQRLRWALAQGERLGTPTTVALAKHNLGLVLWLRGDLEGARRVEREAVMEAARQGDKRIEVASRTYLARFELSAGALEEAAAQAALATEGAPPQMELFARAVLSLAHLAAGRREAALDEARRADELLGRVKGVEEGDALVAVALARALLAQGRKAEAKVALEAGRRRLETRARGIDSEAIRARFLALPDHVELLGLDAT